jgi:DNA-directed RNA polymerase specialized sigma24 family protein
MNYHTLIIPKSLLERIIRNTFVTAYRVGYRAAAQDAGDGAYRTQPTDREGALERALRNAKRLIRREEGKSYL